MKVEKSLVAIILFPALLSLNLFSQKHFSKTFPFSTPEQEGISSATLDSMMLFIKNTHQNIHHITVIRNNKTVLDAAFYPYSPGYLHDLASVTKSLTSLLIGIAIDKGFIKDENETVLKFFPEITNHTQALDSLKIKDLVTMTSGFSCGVADGEKALSDMRKTSEWIKFIFDLPMISKPGEIFSYCSCNFYLLGEIVYRATDLTPHEFAKKYLFDPLQIKNSKWLSNYKGINHGWGDLFLFPSDMAKIGRLLLDKGKWQNSQVISEQWINKSLQTYTKLGDDKGYGYGWWTNDKVGFYEAAGRGRQTIAVIPAKNMVVTMLGGEFDAGTIGKYIFQSIQSNKARPENKTGFARLKATIKKAGFAPTPKKIVTNSTLIHKLNKRMIIFEKNITAIDSLQFNFTSGTNGTVYFYKKQIKTQYPFVLSSNTYSVSTDTDMQLPVALQAECKK